MTSTDWKKKYWELHKKHLNMEQAFIEMARDLHQAEVIIRQLRENSAKKPKKK